MTSSISVVVGGNGALGSAICDQLHAEGHNLVIASRNSAADAPGNAKFHQLDVTDQESVDTFTLWLQSLNAPLRLLVFLPAAPTDGGISDASVDAIMTAVDVKVGGLLRLTRALTSTFNRETAILVIGGNLAFDPIPFAATSGIANAALANTVRQLQFPLGKLGVRIHLIAPGPVDTERWWTLAQAEAKKRGVDSSVILSEATAASSSGKLTTTAEVAWAVSMLANPMAAAMTGSTLLLDGGRRTASP